MTGSIQNLKDGEDLLLYWNDVRDFFGRGGFGTCQNHKRS